MKTGNITIAILFLLSCTIITEAYAQRGMKWRGSGGWGMGSQYNRMYDTKTVETIKGEVISVNKIYPSKGMSYGVHLTLKTDKDTISIHVGPGWYMENQDVKIEPKDRIEITGSRITYEGKQVIIASEIKKGNETLKLRDNVGFPVWAGWRRYENK